MDARAAAESAHRVAKLRVDERVDHDGRMPAGAQHGPFEVRDRLRSGVPNLLELLLRKLSLQRENKARRSLSRGIGHDMELDRGPAIRQRLVAGARRTNSQRLYRILSVFLDIAGSLFRCLLEASDCFSPSRPWLAALVFSGTGQAETSAPQQCSTIGATAASTVPIPSPATRPRSHSCRKTCGSTRVPRLTSSGQCSRAPRSPWRLRRKLKSRRERRR